MYFLKRKLSIAVVLWKANEVIWNIICLVFFFSLNAHVVTSNHSGVGKSLVITRLAEQVSNLQNNRLITDTMKSQDEEPPPLCVTIPFHDKHARVADVVGFFLPHALHSDIPLSRIFHMDRSATVRILFKHEALHCNHTGADHCKLKPSRSNFCNVSTLKQ